MSAPAPQRLPPWFRRALPAGSEGARIRNLLGAQDLHTVCEGARCPNRAACWHDGAAAFLLLGDTCSRDCRFCAIPRAAAPLPPPDPGEPRRLAEAAAAMNLRYVVVTSVTRDDLPDGGAAHFAATIRAIRLRIPGARVEVLIPDFLGSTDSLDIVLDARPDILNHNLETTERLHPAVRPQADYHRSLDVLRHAAQRGARAKSGIMLGLGESADDIQATLRDLRDAGTRLLTMGQYLAPSPAHHPVVRHLDPAEFAAWRDSALRLGFHAVAAGPEVRSSYHAGELAALAPLPDPSSPDPAP